MPIGTNLVIITSFMGKYASNKDDFKLYIATNVFPALEKMGLSVNIQDAYPGAKLKARTYTITYDEEKATPKGIVFQDCLRFSRESWHPTYVIFIDGSGKIDPKYIIDIANGLVNGNLDAVLSRRVGEDKGVSDERWRIEKFELFILEEKFGCPEFPDGQCGLWGFKDFDNAERRLDFRSPDYGIEWNFLSQLLRKKYKYDFVPLIVKNPQKQTGFSREDHLAKLNFICNEEQISKEMLSNFLDKFCSTKMQLPQEYLDDIKKKYSL